MLFPCTVLSVVKVKQCDPPQTTLIVPALLYIPGEMAADSTTALSRGSYL